MSKPRKKIAIIGTGISGLGAASILHPIHDITLYEKNAYIGGHSRTVKVTAERGPVAVDTGFIVFNKRNYPLLTRLFDHLKVPVVKSDMSFGASIANGKLEYSTQSGKNFFAQKKNLLRPAFWRMLLDIFRFNRLAHHYLDKPPSFTLGDCLDELKMGPWFREYFLLPMGGAIWSTPVSDMLRFPAATFIRFFHNHGLLSTTGHPQWYTVEGGSQEYVRRLTEPFLDRILLGCGAKKVRRFETGVQVEDEQGNVRHFDEVVFACHADQALAMIEDPRPEERTVLSAFRYLPNRAVLHSDTSFLPKRRNAWASWVYLSRSGRSDASSVSLSYWMNNLQPLSVDFPLIVTLNPDHEPAPHLVHDDYLFEHPMFDSLAISHQQDIHSIQGNDRLWFCGAYQRFGFHEDGLGSAVTMAEAMGVSPPW